MYTHFCRKNSGPSRRIYGMIFTMSGSPPFNPSLTSRKPCTCGAFAFLSVTLVTRPHTKFTQGSEMVSEAKYGRNNMLRSVLKSVTFQRGKVSLAYVCVGVRAHARKGSKTLCDLSHSRRGLVSICIPTTYMHASSHNLM
jgi:hypothetical protein